MDQNSTEKTAKTILYIVTKSVWGGAQKYVFDLAHSINSGQAVNLTQTRFRSIVSAGGNGPLAQKLKASNIPYFEIKNFQRDVMCLKDIFAFFEILALLFKTRPDMVHVSSAKAGGIVGVACLFYKLLTFNFQLSTIFTAHGWTFSESRPQWQIFLIKFFSKITCLFYDKIICVSEYDYKIAVANKIAPTQKLVAIHNGIKLEDYNFLTKEEARGKLRNQETPLNPPLSGGQTSSLDKGRSGGVWIGAIGEFTKNKGQKYLVEATKQLSAVSRQPSAFLVGFDGGEKENLKSQISNLKLEDRVFLVENLPNPANYLKAFDIFVLPSIKEGLPYVILEAGLAKLPVIATNVGGISEIISSKIPLNLPFPKGETPSFEKGGLGRILPNGILIDPANPKQIADAIKNLIDNPQLRQTLAQNLRAKIITEFSFEKMLNRTVAIYAKKGK